MSNPRPPLRTELQDSDSKDVTTLNIGTIVLLKMKEGYNILNDIKRIGFISKVINDYEYEVTYKYIIGVGPSVKLKKIKAKRYQILNLHLQDKINIDDNKEKIISVLDSVLDKYSYLTNPESHDDMYQTHINELTSLHNSSIGTSLLDKLTNRFSNSSSSDEFKYAEGRRTRHRRKSRHHKKTNRRQKSNMRHKSNRRLKSNRRRKSNPHKMQSRKN
uniref:Uncharacterized protein n=1 Tax=viral metagenome TaxID=1070528 RepID=A0A6C0D5K1_9ZZZZ